MMKKWISPVAVACVFSANFFTTGSLHAAQWITFTNPTSFTFSDNAAASLYPSVITVPAIEGSIADVTVTVTGINHTFPDDIDMLLQGPSGNSIFLMSDVGASNDFVNVNLTFTDGPIGLPDSLPVASGRYSPTNFGSSDTMPAPAPPEPSAGGFAAFLGEIPSGTWSLFARDDGIGDLGSLSGGWSLSLLIDEPPVVRILGRKKLTVRSQGIVINGAAADDLSGPPKVFVTINGGTAKLALGTTPLWKFRGRLKPGTNVVRAFAVDGAGNISATVRQTIIVRR